MLHSYQVWIITLCSIILNCSMNSIKDFCIGDEFIASCMRGSIVVMTHATFGTMSTGRCAKSSNHCEEDITEYVDNQCSGRQNCQFPITNIIHDVQPCSDTLPSMRGAYGCVKVSKAPTSDCYQHQAMIITEFSGTFSSLLTENDNVGSLECPWRIQAPEGKKIVITLIDFGIWQRRLGPSLACERYGTLIEHSTGEQTSICGGNQRTQVVYKSTTSTLNVAIGGHDQHYFLIQYNVTGCSGYTVSGAQVVTAGDTASATCRATGETWKMTCVDSEWTGNELKCEVSFVSDYIFGDDWETSHVLLLVLSVGIVLGFLVGMCCIYSVVWCLRRRNTLQRGKTSTQLCMQDRPAPLEPDYHYKYVTGMNRQNDPLLQNNHTFIDPHTGMVYGKYNSRKDDMYGGGDAGNGTIRMNALKDNHIYNTLEPRPDVLECESGQPPQV